MQRLPPVLLTCWALLSGCSSLLPTLRLSAQSRRSRTLRIDRGEVRHDWYGQALLTARWPLGSSDPLQPQRPEPLVPSDPVLAGRVPCVAFCAWERAAVRSAR